MGTYYNLLPKGETKELSKETLDRISYWVELGCKLKHLPFPEDVRYLLEYLEAYGDTKDTTYSIFLWLYQVWGEETYSASWLSIDIPDSEHLKEYALWLDNLNLDYDKINKEKGNE